MGKAKKFIKTDLTIPMIEHTRDHQGNVKIMSAMLPPTDMVVRFPPNTSGHRSVNFAPWYGVGIDPITYTVHRQIERFLAKQDAELAVTTIVGFAKKIIRSFLGYLVIHSAAHERSLGLSDINRAVMDGYLRFLRDEGLGVSSQRHYYSTTKSLLTTLAARGIVSLVLTGDDSTFPASPFPNCGRRSKGGARPLARAERQAFIAAVKTAVMPLFDDDVILTSNLIGWALLVVALHTGRNKTPLIELERDCVIPHPRDKTCFLRLFKRRGYTTQKVALQADLTQNRVIESLPTVRPTVLRLIRRVIELTEPLVAEAPVRLKNRLWLFRYRHSTGGGQVTAMNEASLSYAIQSLVDKYQLKDRNGNALQINVSRLRKTFVNRINEILGGDVATTAIAAGNTPRVTEQHYLESNAEAHAKFRFLGTILVNELLDGTLGATERTPVGRCSDIKNGGYAPKRDGAVCFKFFDCLRCRNYVVTGEDLYRLFSYYWRVYDERARMSVGKWKKSFAHIVRLIDRDVVEQGVRRRIFKTAAVLEAKKRARLDPHPFWKGDMLFKDLKALL